MNTANFYLILGVARKLFDLGLHLDPSGSGDLLDDDVPVKRGVDLIKPNSMNDDLEDRRPRAIDSIADLRAPKPRARSRRSKARPDTLP